MPSLKIDLIVDDQGNVTIQNATKNVQALDAETKKLGSTMGSTFDGIVKGAAAAAAAWLTVEGASRAAHMVMQQMETGTKVMQAETAFNNATKSIGASSEQMLASIKRVTNGTVDAGEIMQKSMKWMSAGMDENKVTQIWEVSRLAARRMGVDVSQAAADIGDAIETMRARALRAYGLITPGQAKLIEEAKAAGIEFDVMKIVMENYANQAGKIGEATENAAERFQQTQVCGQRDMGLDI